MIVDKDKNYTLQEIKRARPRFFHNRAPSESEEYSIRKNHLIVHNVTRGSFAVWQFHTRDGKFVLSPVWFPKVTTVKAVHAALEEMLTLGKLPLHTWS